MDKAHHRKQRLTVGMGHSVKNYDLLGSSGWCFIDPRLGPMALVDRPLASLPVLELPFEQIQKDLLAAGSAEHQFPFLLVVDAALVQGHEYWISHAVDWTAAAKQNSLPWVAAAIGKLGDLSGMDKYSQSLRHRIKRLVVGAA